MTAINEAAIMIAEMIVITFCFVLGSSLDFLSVMYSITYVLLLNVSCVYEQYINMQCMLYIHMVTSIRIEETTKLRLARLGKYGQTMDDIINDVLDKVKSS